MSLQYKSALSRRIKNNVFTLFCWISIFFSIGLLLSVLIALIVKGLPGLSYSLFIQDTKDMGIRNALIGSVMMTVSAIVVVTPISILAATFLVEMRHRQKLTSAIRFMNDILLSAPSVIIGLFVYTILVAHTRFSGFAGIIALAIIAMPMITRGAEDVLYLVSSLLKESAIALGISKWRVTIMIVYRSARSGLITAVILAMARIMGESAPLLFTSAKNSFLSFDLSHSMESLPVMIFENAMQPYPELQNLAWTGALIITLLVLVMNLSARWFARNKET
jgi:phosphate transport system permease protein